MRVYDEYIAAESSSPEDKMTALKQANNKVFEQTSRPSLYLHLPAKGHLQKGTCRRALAAGHLEEEAMQD
jgi:hypothetical protein